MGGINFARTHFTSFPFPCNFGVVPASGLSPLSKKVSQRYYRCPSTAGPSGSTVGPSGGTAGTGGSVASAGGSTAVLTVVPPLVSGNTTPGA